MATAQNEKLIKTVKLLSDLNYHDGTSLGEALNITRAAVWKIIKKLEAYGIIIESTKGKGYKLNSPLILLDKKVIKKQLNNQHIQFDILEKVGSSNEHLKKLSRNKKIKACITEMQTQGKGRFNREWHSPFAENSYISLCYPLQKDLSELAGLSLVVGLAICQAIEAYHPLPQALSVKWPNDIMYDKKKLGGVLIEVQAEAHGMCHVIIGMGLNINMQKAQKKDISQPWTSLSQITGQYHDRNILSALILDHVINYLAKFSQSDFSAFEKEWQQRDALFNQSLALISNKEKFNGVGAGINAQGQLMLRLNNGMKQTFASGDTSLLQQ